MIYILKKFVKKWSKSGISPLNIDYRSVVSARSYRLLITNLHNPFSSLGLCFKNLFLVNVQEGFWYHHAKATHLMLVYWIPQTPDTIPANASHRVGISAFVTNDKGEVLITFSSTTTFLFENIGSSSENLLCS